MERDARSYLWDARHSADTIFRFVAGATEADYLADEMRRAAVERHFEIIGEALGRLARSRPGLAARIADLPRAVAFRNLLIHGYAAIDNATVWRIIQDDLPTLRDQVAGLLAELDSSSAS